MHDLKALTALGATNPLGASVGEMSITENPDLALASLSARSGHESAFQERATALLGNAAPGPGRSVKGDAYAAFWMGPDQWMISAPFETHEDIAALLKERFEDTASITEQTDAWVCFDINGNGVDAALELLCSVNLRKAAPGDATRSSIHHSGCFVICETPHKSVRIIGPRASARSLYDALLNAIKAVA